jgi:hypothetical protein
MLQARYSLVRLSGSWCQLRMANTSYATAASNMQGRLPDPYLSLKGTLKNPILEIFQGEKQPRRHRLSNPGNDFTCRSEVSSPEP